MPDHVHMFIKTQPIQPPQFTIGQLKGFGSYLLKPEFSNLKSRLSILWTRSYYVDSVGKLMNIQLGSISKIKQTNRRFHPNAKAKGFFR